jgi:hypothetical protein
MKSATASRRPGGPAKLTAAREKLQSSVVFIVRDDRAGDFLLQCSDTTGSASNRWPSQGSLYDDGTKQWYWGPGVRVSWDRPDGKYCRVVDSPLSQGSGAFLLWEFPLAFWMEKQGHDVAYVSNVDTHADGPGLLRARGWLSVGHDEYWSREMYRHVRAAIAAHLPCIGDGRDLVGTDVPVGHLHRRRLPLGGVAPGRVLVRRRADLVTPMDLDPLALRPGGDGRVGLLQPPAHLLGVLPRRDCAPVTTDP